MNPIYDEVCRDLGFTPRLIKSNPFKNFFFRTWYVPAIDPNKIVIISGI